MEQKVASLKTEMARLRALEAEMVKAPDQQISETDPDPRSMKTHGEGMVGYNVQTAVDVNSHMVISHDVTNVGNDRNLLADVATEAKEALEVDSLTAIADRSDNLNEFRGLLFYHLLQDFGSMKFPGLMYVR